MVAAALIVLAVAIPTILVVGPKAPWLEAVLGQGRVIMDIPLTTIYTAPPLPNGTASTTANVSFNSGYLTCLINETTRYGVCDGPTPSILAYRWSLVSGTELPIRFVMSPEPSSNDTHRHFDAGGDSLEYFPAGPYVVHSYPVGAVVPSPPLNYQNVSLEGVGQASVLVSKWAVDYTIRKFGVFSGLTATSYLEVDYNVTVLDAGTVLRLPAANVSAPSSSDLWVPTQSLTLPANQEGGSTGIGVLSSFRVPPPPVPYGNPPYFRYNLTPVSMDAGSIGSISVRLQSFQEDAFETLHFSWDRTVQFHLYLDMRFGSVLLAYGTA